MTVNLPIRTADVQSNSRMGPADLRALSCSNPQDCRRGMFFLSSPPGLHHPLETAAKTNRGEMSGGEKRPVFGITARDPRASLPANHPYSPTPNLEMMTLQPHLASHSLPTCCLPVYLCPCTPASPNVAAILARLLHFALSACLVTK